MYAAGAVAAYLGYNYYKKQQGKAQAPTAPATVRPQRQRQFQAVRLSRVLVRHILKT